MNKQIFNSPLKSIINLCLLTFQIANDIGTEVIGWPIFLMNQFLIQISAMLGNLDGLESSDVASISTSVLRFWIKSPEVKKINSKIRSLNQLLRLGWSKTTNEAEVLAGKLLKNCLHVEELCEDSLIEAANGLCSGNSREEAWLVAF